MLLDHDTSSIHATHHVLLETPPSHYKTKQYKNSQYRVLIQEIHAQCHKIQYTVLIRVIRAFSGRWDDIAGNIYYLYLCASSDPKLLLLQRTLEFWLILGERYQLTILFQHWGDVNLNSTTNTTEHVQSIPFLLRQDVLFLPF